MRLVNLRGVPPAESVLCRVRLFERSPEKYMIHDLIKNIEFIREFIPQFDYKFSTLFILASNLNPFLIKYFNIKSAYLR